MIVAPAAMMLLMVPRLYEPLENNDLQHALYHLAMAAFGLVENTFETEVGKSVWSAPEVPPTMFPDVSSEPIVFSALITDGSVHLIWCFESLSYISGPAWRR